MSQTDKVNNELPPLRYHETLDLFQDTIAQYYSEKSVEVYRTVRNNPPTDEDLLPQKYLNKSEQEIRELLIEYTAEDVEYLTEQDKKDEIGENAVSVNTSVDRCISSARRTYNKVKEKHPGEEEKFKEIRGSYVAKLKINPEHGLLSRTKNGHRNFLPREGVGMLDIWDQSFDLISFDYEDGNMEGDE